ncbi:MAG: DEAD/DEAH box helicase [Planctomycetota bacterium]|nr:DEAD/DEAH box helicase [Planctomycetota bacterium]
MPQAKFSELGLLPELVEAVSACGYDTPTPIQAQSIPELLKGFDLLGIAQTGTGKTAAFTLPMLQWLAGADDRPRPGRPRALVLTPTRELAAQIHESCVAYGRELKHLRYAVIFGGVSQKPQEKILSAPLDVLVATPGRLLDLIGQGRVHLDEVEVFVLDEADRMLDMGFIRDVEKVIARLHEDRQSVLFSATMPPEIVALTKRILHQPVRVEVTPPAKTADRIEQSVYFVEKADKRHLLAELLSDGRMVRTLVFTRTKHGADRVARHLTKGGIQAAAIHGNKSQNARERALDGFKNGKIPVLVATDLAARGIDVDDVTHVVNFDLPNVPETYVHRIGRTARAGREGIAMSFCDVDERPLLRDIEKLIRRTVPVVAEHPYRSNVPLAAPPAKPAQGSKGGGGARRGPRQNRGRRR